MLEIPGYQIFPPFHKGHHSIICRGIKQEEPQQSVIIKASAVTPPSPAYIERLQQEFKLGKSITSKHVVNYLELKADPNYGFILIEEDDQAEALINHIPPKGFGPLDFLNIAIPLAEGLLHIHRSRVIHKDIKPENIVIRFIQSDSGEVKYIIVKYIDFSSASLWRQYPQPTTTPMVTLAYISPELTGRINRDFDFRTDIYSLGATFYHLICGILPFTVKDVRELIYCHLAKKPLAPYDVKSDIPKPLSDIIMKLLEKDADDRYQSAYGLWLDLKKCHEEFTQKREIASFKLAQHDVPEYLYIQQKLYGREPELDRLTQACQRISASEGLAEIVMIAGPAGTGKSVLVQEIQPIITMKQGGFLIGKFELLNRNIAYSAITQALGDWIKQVLAGSAEEILTWKTQLLDETALSNQGKVLIEVIPNLELIIGEQPPVPILDAEHTKARLHLFFQRFIKVLAKPSHPLALFLDDWQWADAESLTLLETMMAPDMKNLLLIGAYRNDEANVNASHPAMVTLDKLKKAGVVIQTITLSPLNETTTNQWIAETLHRPLEITRPLTTLIYQKTEGVPFFIKVFLQVLYEQGLLTRVEENWQWDLEKIRLLPATENVIAFMTHKIQQLPSETQNTLRFASCMYHRFTLNTLQLITQKSSEVLHTELQPLLESGLLLPINDHFQFAHDRVREAAYQQMNEKTRNATHLTIGHLLRDNLPAQPTLEQIFEVTDHLNQGNQGESLTTNPKEQLKLAKLNLETAQRAKAAAAYATALNYLRAAKKYITVIGTDIAWKEHYQLTYDLYKALAGVEFLNDHIDESTKYIEDVLKHAKTDLEKADIYNLYIIQETFGGRYKKAIEIGINALGLLKIDLKTQDLEKLWKEEFQQIKENLQGKTMDMLFDAPLMEDPDSKAKETLLYNIAAPTYLADQFVYGPIIAIATNLILRYGNTVESAFIYTGYGVLLISRFNEISLGHDFGLLAIRLSDKFPDLSSRCRTNFVHGAVLHSWRKPLREAKVYFDRAQQMGLEAGELQYLGYALQAKALYFFYEGLPLTSIEEELNKLLQLPYVRANQMALSVIRSLQLVILNLKGQTPDETAFQDAVKTDRDYQADWQKNRNFFELAHYLILKTQALYLHGKFQEALEILSSAQNYLSSISGWFDFAVHNFYHSLILTALYPKVGLDTQRDYWQKLEANQAQMKIWADNCPENFSNKYFLVAAEMASIANHPWEAMGHYEKAMQLAQQQNFLQDQAIANELAAKSCLAHNRPSYAPGLLLTAYQCYERWGAKRKVKQLVERYGSLLNLSTIAKLSDFTISGKETISAESLRQLDLISILQASQAISSEVDLRRLLVTIMNILIKNAGAQKGAFLLEESGSLLVQAEYTQKGEIETLKRLPLFQWEEGAHSIIEYVKHTQQPLLLGNASTDHHFSQDPYIKTHHIKSVLCIPVIRQQLIGILYIENNLAPNVFTEQHQQTLTILASQIAISLESVTAYESIQSITQRLNLALLAGNVGTWSWDIPTNKVIWDHYMYKLFGVKKEDFNHTLEDFIMLVHPEDTARVKQAIEKTVKENAPYDIEFRIIRPEDTSVHVVTAQGKVYQGDKGQVEGMSGAVWDITQRKRLEEERMQALAQAEEKERYRAEDAEKHRKEMEDFINKVCHEIRNPMLGISGNIEFLQDTISKLQASIDKLPIKLQPIFNALLDEMKGNIEVIEHCAEYQKTILNDTLDLAKLKAGKKALKAEPLRLKTVIEEVWEMFIAPAAAKELSLEKSLLPPESDPWIKSDADRLKTALINFVNNALKFTEKGTITINLQLLDVTSTYTHFTLSVKDTGIGMTPEEQTQLFQRFAQVGAPKYGSGLGLLLSKELIEDMGGKIRVESQERVGSQFTIELTCETAHEEEKLVPPPVVVPSAPLVVSSAAKPILVVEDNEVNQKILCSMLVQIGYNCKVANNGREAVDQWSSAAFDLIFMDLIMPIMKGSDATREIRKKERERKSPRTAIIGVSAQATETAREEVIKAGMDGYITKPFKRREIYDAVKKWSEAQSKLIKHTFVYQPSDVDYPVHSVHLAGSFNGWLNPIDGRIKSELYPQWSMKGEGTLWKLTILLAPGSHQFKYVINETVWRSDPNYVLSEDEHKNSILQIDPPKHEIRTTSPYLSRQTFMPPSETSKAEETEEEKKPEDPKDYAMMGPTG